MSSQHVYHFQSGAGPEGTSRASHPSPRDPSISDAHYYDYSGQPIPPPSLQRAPTPPSDLYRVPSPERSVSPVEELRFERDISDSCSRALVPANIARLYSAHDRTTAKEQQPARPSKPVAPPATLQPAPYPPAYAMAPPMQQPGPNVPFGFGAYYYQHPHPHPYPYPQPIPPPPPSTDVQIVKSEKIETVTHGRESPRTALAYHSDPYNLRATQGTKEMRTPSKQYHICAVCRRPRSSRYHKEHPLVPGQQIIPEVCRKCRVTESSGGEPESDNYSDDKVIVNKGKSAVRETERVRIVNEVPLHRERGRHRSRSQHPRDQSQTRVIIRTRSARRQNPSPVPLKPAEVPPGYMLVPVQAIPPPPPPEEMDDLSEDWNPMPSKKTLPPPDKSIKSANTPLGTSRPPHRLLRHTEEWEEREFVPILPRQTERSPSPEPAARKPPLGRGRRHPAEEELLPAEPSDAEKRMASHPSAFRYGYFIQAEPEHTAKQPSRAYEDHLGNDPDYMQSYYQYKSSSAQMEMGKGNPRPVLRPSSQSARYEYEGPPNEDAPRRSQESTTAEFGGNRVQFVPEVPNAPLGRSAFDSGLNPSRLRQRLRTDVKENESKYGGMSGKGRDNFESLDPLPPGYYYARASEDRREGPPNTSASMYVEAPRTMKPAPSGDPRHASMHPEPPKTAKSALREDDGPMVYHYGGKRFLDEPKQVQRPPPRSMPRRTSLLTEPSAGSKEPQVTVREYDEIDVYGRLVRVREVEEMHLPPKSGKLHESKKGIVRDIDLDRLSMVDEMGRPVRVREIEDEELFVPDKSAMPEGSKRRGGCGREPVGAWRDI